MRRILTLALAATVAALVAAGIRRLMEPDPQEAIPAAGDGAPADKPSASSPEAEEPTRDELYTEAQRLEIQGRSKMNKQQLQEAVDAAKTGGPV